MTDLAIAVDGIVVQELSLAHQVVLSWTGSTDMPSPIPAGSGYNIFRGTATGKESTQPINAAPIAALTFTDTSITPGAYFYTVETLLNGASSVASNEVSAVVLPAPPTALVLQSIS